MVIFIKIKISIQLEVRRHTNLLSKITTNKNCLHITNQILVCNIKNKQNYAINII